jgi:hypothetical protein
MNTSGFLAISVVLLAPNNLVRFDRRFNDLCGFVG